MPAPSTRVDKQINSGVAAHDARDALTLAVGRLQLARRYARRAGGDGPALLAAIDLACTQIFVAADCITAMEATYRQRLGPPAPSRQTAN